MRARTGYDRDSFFVDGYGVFVNAVEPPHAAGNTPLVTPGSVDLLPKPDSGVVDAGVLIPGINDDFVGKAPDIGALEFGKASPSFGPRSRERSAGKTGQDAAIE
jgi:hypothetical protein